MQYAPGIAYRGDQYIAQGGQQMAGAMMQLMQYLINRGQQKEALQAQAETLAGPSGANAVYADGSTAPVAAAPAGGGGFNPVTPQVTADGEQDHPAVTAGKQADALRKVIMSYSPQSKDVHDAIKAMSLGQLEGFVKGAAMRQTAEEHAARMDDFRAQAEMRRQRAADDVAVGRALK